ncbi:MAG: hypothetical protein M3Y74_22525 [Chloroflexota bacterium]|nr:hypothetical protein [Chloroflexota bacterium]
MANRVFLVQIDAPDPDGMYDADAIVVAANSMLPVLWCTAFTEDDIAWRVVPAREDEGLEKDESDDEGDGRTRPAYPILLATTDTIQRRARDRRELFFRAFPRTLEDVYSDWLMLLDGIDTPYLLVDTLEVWGMGEPEVFEADLIECVTAFENDDPRYWSGLLRQARIRWNPIARTMTFDDAAMPVLSHGYEWLRPVPWAESEVDAQP